MLKLGILVVTSWSSTAVINFLNAKSKYTTLTFSKSSSSSCPGTYSLFISSSLYAGKSSSLGTSILFVSESLSITSFPSASFASVISAKFVNFLPNSAVSFTLHAIFTSLYDNVVPSNAFIIFAPVDVSLAFDK